MDTQPMTDLMNQMAKGKGNSGFVVFVVQSPMPLPLPMFGRPHGTREEATEAAQEMLQLWSVSRAWTVGSDSVREVAKPETGE